MFGWLLRLVCRRVDRRNPRGPLLQQRLSPFLSLLPDHECQAECLGDPVRIRQ
jgi:hypothetical protein